MSKKKLSLADLRDLLPQEPAAAAAAPATAKFSLALFKDCPGEGLEKPDIGGPYASFPQRVHIYVPLGEEITLEKIQEILPERGYVFSDGFVTMTTVTPTASGWEMLGTQEVSRGTYVQGRWTRVKEEMVEIQVNLDLVPLGGSRPTGSINRKDYSAKSSGGSGMGHDDGFMHQG